MAIEVSFKSLRELLGKEVEDPKVKAVLAKSGKLTIKSDFVIAREAGFDFSLDRPEGAKKKQLTCLFLYAEGRDKHRGFVDLPAGFAFTTRDELLAALPAPKETWKIGKGKVAVTVKNPDHDTWAIDGFEVSADYRDGAVRGIQVTLADDGERDLSTSPLHFETVPVDAPKGAALMGMALLVAWSADRFGLPAKHDSALGKQLVKRAITPRAFYLAAIKKGLSSTDVDRRLGDFLWGYTHRMFLSTDDGAREKLDAKLHTLLRLEAANKKEDERAYSDDYLGTFSDLESAYYVPDSWEALERIAPVLDARWADFEATGFETNPDVKRYEQAAKLRDAVTLVADRAGVAVKGAVDDTLADALVALIDKPVKDAAVKAVLERAGLPLAKKIDTQANVPLGVSYGVANLAVGGKKVLCVDSVTFYAAKQTTYLRSLGTEVEFGGYPAKLLRGLVMGATRKDVAKALGKVTRTYENTDYWSPKGRMIMCDFENGTLVSFHVGQPPD